ncbi:hypothetical protein KAI92_02555 [Candidatus Parcubacteria bacterium]|nr:hypothetical protein [Candidatus Parcubacteria bacterium]
MKYSNSIVYIFLFCLFFPTLHVCAAPLPSLMVSDSLKECRTLRGCSKIFPSGDWRDHDLNRLPNYKSELERKLGYKIECERIGYTYSSKRFITRDQIVSNFVFAFTLILLLSVFVYFLKNKNKKKKSLIMAVVIIILYLAFYGIFNFRFC